MEIAREIKHLLEQDVDIHIQEDSVRGFDHGVWSTLVHLFPMADIPVICMSLDYSASPSYLFHL